MTTKRIKQATASGLLIVARINIRQARTARREGNERMAKYHAAVALSSRRDANAILNRRRSTSTH